MTRDEQLSMIYSKLAVMQGCGRAIDMETRNTPDSRHKGRMVQRDADEIMDLLRDVLKPMRDEMDQASHDNEAPVNPLVQSEEVL